MTRWIALHRERLRAEADSSRGEKSYLQFNPDNNLNITVARRDVPRRKVIQFGCLYESNADASPFHAKIDTGLSLCAGGERDRHKASSGANSLFAHCYRSSNLREVLVAKRPLLELAVPAHGNGETIFISLNLMRNFFLASSPAPGRRDMKPRPVYAFILQQQPVASAR